MHSKIALVALAVILLLLNYSIYEKEQIRSEGQDLLLELAPVDPRSLMQGDYMALRYAIERQAMPATEVEDHGYIVVQPDAKRIAQFQRFDQGESLQENELKLRYHLRHGRLVIVPHSFLFQEGHAQYYERARYGLFKVNAAGDSLLVGLADSEGQVIIPPEPATEVVSGN